MTINTQFTNTITFLEGLANMRSGMLDKGSSASPSLYLNRTKALIKELGLDLSKIKFIHLAGTSGKGSVSNLVYQKLLSEGKRAGLFTSPFVTSTIEKIDVNGKFIAPKDFVRITEQLKGAIDRVYTNYQYGCPSYFECITAIGLAYFIEQKCEYVVMETGLGGRYDSTNILPSPVVTAITNIDLDHTDILGDTLEKIAYEKAGIIKKGSTFYTAEHRSSLLTMFKEICAKEKAEFNVVNTKGLSIDQKNKALAEAILSGVGITGAIDDEIVELKLPARFETVSEQPLIIIDGAHNPAKMKSTAENWKRTKAKGKRILVIGMSANKDAKEVLKQIIPLADEVYITRFLTTFRKAAEPKEMYNIAKKYAKPNTSLHLMIDPVSAFNVAKANMKSSDAILVTGSFFLAGDIRSIFYPEEFILKKRESK